MNHPKSNLKTEFENALLVAGQRLRDQGHRVTRPRQFVLATLFTSDCAATQEELSHTLEKTGLDVDRVTVYRVLEWLVEHKLAHRVASDSRAWKFNALKNAEHEHGHFACRDCERVFCLDEPNAPVTPPMPAGFSAEESELLIRGRCPDCSG